jgi:hypothetical protein
MQHISNQLQTVSNTTTTLSLSERSQSIAESLPAEERKIMEIKYASKRFGDMNQAEIDRSADALLLKIHTITGWNFPDVKIAVELQKQFILKMRESYANVNADEVEYAFRKGGTTVKDWGKSMNLSLIDEVMIPYLEQRASLSKIEESKALPELEEKEDVGDKAMYEWYLQTYEQVKTDKIKLDFVPAMVGEWMERKGMLLISENYQIEAAVKIGKQLHLDISREGRAEYRQYREMFEKGVFSDRYSRMITDLAKRMALWDSILKSDEPVKIG